MTVAASMMSPNVVSLPPGTQLPSATNSSTAASSSAAAGSANSTLTESDFLTLLTTQLENQDPLNPQSPSDMAAELAQFSTASGVQTLNTTVGATSGIDAAGLVGKNVAVSGNTLILGSNGSAQGAFSLSAAASDVGVTIANSSGSVVATVDLGAMGAGSQGFSWNGQGANGTGLPAGNYSYTINATPAVSGTKVTATPYAVVPVTSVGLGGSSGPTLDLGGGLAPVALSAVQEVF
jgi:flagellar basal-body rod modification protein FlgD